MSYRESHLAMEILAEADIITSAEFVEVNPILDERNKTAEAAVALMGSLFGENLNKGSKKMTEFRTERDFLGEKQVPAEAYYGIQTILLKKIFLLPAIRRTRN